MPGRSTLSKTVVVTFPDLDGAAAASLLVKECPDAEIVTSSAHSIARKLATVPSKKKQTVVQVKEIKLRPKTATHDLEVKVRAITRFLAEGNKAKLVIQFRGREIVHPETGKAVLHKVLTELGDSAVVEQWPVMEGRRMNMLVAPRPGGPNPAGSTRPAASADKPTASEQAEA